MNQKSQTLPPQHQSSQPGRENQMRPAPVFLADDYKASNKLQAKVAIITGGDSGIGRSVALTFAREGADVAIVYLNEEEDAKKTKQLIENMGKTCLTFAGDVGDVEFCQKVVKQTFNHFNRIDILVNNAAEQHVTQDFKDITPEQLEKTFRTNIFAYFFMAQAALPYLKKGASIINTTSVTAYKGSNHLIDYSATKGAIVTFTRSLSQSLVQQGVRVNAVAPGPIWTPLIPATFPADKVAEFGGNVPMGRPGQPNEVASCYVFLASDDASYISGQVLHPNGGTIVNG
jgi:NAD(P)-dependent dehydrogenase (short-subunit alcohol dehydrogenase family)